MSETYTAFINREQEKQSKFSPCVVSDQETISRLIFSPKQYCEETKRIFPNAFEQIKYEGLSVLRKNYDFKSCINNVCDIITRKDNGKILAGFTSADVSKIREAKNNGVRFFVVLDTARENMVGHADVESILTQKNITTLPSGLSHKYIAKKISDLFEPEITKI